MNRGRTVGGVVALCLLGLGLAPGGAAAKGPTAGASVIGGKPAAVSDWGYTAAILERGKFSCSGTVISPTKILTAAHCIKTPPAQLAVITGRARLGNGGGQVIGVTAAVRHPGFAGKYNDIGVLTLAAPTTAPPVALADATEDAASTVVGSPLSIAGYGRRNPLAFGKPLNGVLMAAQVFSRPGCNKYGRAFSSEVMVCALGLQYARIARFRFMRSVCFGDSGGPLLASTAAGPRLVGISSYVVRTHPAILCAWKGLPNVYTRVAPYLGFIQANL